MFELCQTYFSRNGSKHQSIIMQVFPHENVLDICVLHFSIGALDMYSVTGIRLWFRDFPAAELTFVLKSGIFNLDKVHPVVAIVGPHELDGFGRFCKVVAFAIPIVIAIREAHFDDADWAPEIVPNSCRCSLDVCLIKFLTGSDERVFGMIGVPRSSSLASVKTHRPSRHHWQRE